MSKSNTTVKSSNIVTGVFLVSLIIFVIGLLPASYSAGYLFGTAGVESDPTTPVVPSADNTPETPFEKFLGILPGIVTVVTGLYGVQIARAQFMGQKMILKKAEIESDMQKREIEKLFLELELEKQKSQRGKINQKNRAKPKTQIKQEKQMKQLKKTRG